MSPEAAATTDWTQWGPVWFLVFLILGVIVYGVRSAWFALWPYLQRFFDGHNSLVTRLDDSSGKTADALQELAKGAKNQETQTSLLGKVVTGMDTMTDTQRLIHTEVKALHEKVDKIPQLLVQVNAPNADRVEHHEHPKLP